MPLLSRTKKSATLHLTWSLYKQKSKKSSLGSPGMHHPRSVFPFPEVVTLELEQGTPFLILWKSSNFLLFDKLNSIIVDRYWFVLARLRLTTTLMALNVQLVHPRQVIQVNLPRHLGSSSSLLQPWPLPRSVPQCQVAHSRQTLPFAQHPAAFKTSQVIFNSAYLDFTVTATLEEEEEIEKENKCRIYSHTWLIKNPSVWQWHLSSLANMINKILSISKPCFTVKGSWFNLSHFIRRNVLHRYGHQLPKRDMTFALTCLYYLVRKRKEETRRNKEKLTWYSWMLRNRSCWSVEPFFVSRLANCCNILTRTLVTFNALWFTCE